MTNNIFGIPYAWTDHVIQKVSFRDVEDKDSDYNSPKAAKFNSTSIVINVNMHFVESQYIIEYFTIGDVFSSFGGLFASLNLIASWVGAIFVIMFLWRIIDIFQHRVVQAQYIQKMLKFLEQARD